MTGRTVFIAMFVFVAIFAAGLFYAINYAHYDETQHDEFEIAGLEVSNYRQIDGNSSPIKFRACFNAAEGTKIYAEAGEPTPLTAPFWFDCFDVEKLTNDIANGALTAAPFDINEPFGVTSYIAIYPDGSGYAWRQINECGEAKFAGHNMPADCPDNTESKE